MKNFKIANNHIKNHYKPLTGVRGTKQYLPGHYGPMMVKVMESILNNPMPVKKKNSSFNV